MPQDSIKFLGFEQLDTALLGVNPVEITPPGGLPEACFFLQVKNYSNISIFISFGDPAIPNFFVLPNTFEPFTASFGQQPNNRLCVFPKHMPVFITSAIAGPGVGIVYLEGAFQLPT